MAKKGKKGGGGGAKKKDAYVPTAVPLRPMMQHTPNDEPIPISIRGRTWSVMDFTVRLPISSTVGDLAEVVANRQGRRSGSSSSSSSNSSSSLGSEFSLYRGEVVQGVYMLRDPLQRLGDVDWPDRDARIVTYDYLPTGFWYAIATRVVSSPKRPSSAGVARRSQSDPFEPRLFPVDWRGSLSAKVAPVSIDIMHPASMGVISLGASSYTPYTLYDQGQHKRISRPGSAIDRGNGCRPG